MKDADGGVWENLATLFARELVRLDVVLVLVFLREEIFVKLELLSAVFAN